jgi:hypothetical protein
MANNETPQTFTCSNCSEEKEIKELANTVEVYGDEPVKTCRECYDLFHNPPKEKKERENFFCSFCRFDVISIKHRIRVSVSEPNELGLKKGETYNFCSACRKKVVEYNVGEEDGEAEIWE